jgi:hypothetical protein
MKLNMFRAKTAHHQEPKTAQTSFGSCTVLCCNELCLTTYTNYTSNNLPRMKTRGCQCSFRLLMMGVVSPETCWASYKYGIIKFDTLLHLVGFFFMNFTESLFYIIRHSYIFLWLGSSWTSQSVITFSSPQTRLAQTTASMWMVLSVSRRENSFLPHVTDFRGVRLTTSTGFQWHLSFHSSSTDHLFLHVNNTQKIIHNGTGSTSLSRNKVYFLKSAVHTLECPIIFRIDTTRPQENHAVHP